MELTFTVNFADHTATMREVHALCAGDVYNPFTLDLSRLSATQLAAVDTSTLTMALYRDNAAAVPIASVAVFSAPPDRSRVRQGVLNLDTQPVLDVFEAESGAEGYNPVSTVRAVVSDDEHTYVDCLVPFRFRSFSVGSGAAAYYTASQVDALLARKQDVLAGAAPVAVANGEVSVAAATSGTPGIVRPAAGLAVVGGALSVAASDSVENGGTLPVQAAAVAAALSRKVDAVDGKGLSAEDFTAALKAKLDGVEAQAQKNVKPDWNAAAGSSAEILNKPAIPQLSSITFTASATTVEPVAGVHGAATATVSGTAPNFVLSIGVPAGDKGAKGDTGDVRVYKEYESATAMQAAFSTDGVPLYGLAIVTAGDDRGKIYRKGAAQYELVSALVGPAGADGRDTAWHVTSGAAATAALTGVAEGDLVLQTDTFLVRRCTAAAAGVAPAQWTDVGVIRGDDGDDGDDGSDGSDGATWSYGSDLSKAAGQDYYTGAAGKAGDFYLASNAGSTVYRCTQSGNNAAARWDKVADLKGADGTDGDDGDDGAAWHARGTDLSLSGTGYYTGEAGKAGDICLVSAGDIPMYQCGVTGTSSTARWTKLADLRGADGATWFVGTAVTGEAGSNLATVPGARTGDFYMNPDTSGVYRCAGPATGTMTAWAFISKLLGGTVVTGPASPSHAAGGVPAWGSTANAVGDGYTVGTNAVAASSTPASSASSDLATSAALAKSLAVFMPPVYLTQSNGLVQTHRYDDSGTEPPFVYPSTAAYAAGQMPWGHLTGFQDYIETAIGDSFEVVLSVPAGWSGTASARIVWSADGSAETSETGVEGVRFRGWYAALAPGSSLGASGDPSVTLISPDVVGTPSGGIQAHVMQDAGAASFALAGSSEPQTGSSSAKLVLLRFQRLPYDGGTVSDPSSEGFVFVHGVEVRFLA